MPLTISSPLRILLLTLEQAPPPPSLSSDNAAYEIRTTYYNATIPIWRDDLPASGDVIEAWKEEWLGKEAGEVVRALGAWICCFRKPNTKVDLALIRQLLLAVHSVAQSHTTDTYDCSSDPLFLAVGTHQSSAPALEVSIDEWDDICRDCGNWEWIDGAIDNDIEVGSDSSSSMSVEARTKMVTKNEYGEMVGLARLKEALEANEWEGGGDEVGALSDSEAGDALDFIPEFSGVDHELGANRGEGKGFGKEAEEMQSEIWGLQDAIRRGETSGVNRDAEHGDQEEEEGGKVQEGGDMEVQELENLMLKMQAVRDLGSDMPEAERKRFAAKAVRDVMRNL